MNRKKIKSTWTEYFNFSTRERRGTLFLSFIILIQIALLFYLRSYPVKISIPDEKIVAALLEVSKSEAAGDSNIHVINSAPSIKSLFPFDPNLTEDSSLLNLGLSRKQIHVIRNYLSHGGKFKIKNDFKKMYCISEKEYKNFEPYILLPDSFHYKTESKKNNPRKRLSVDLAAADSVKLVDLRGIGPVLASRIVKYREKLGGFYSLQQLLEVWGINDSLFQILQPSITLNNTIPFRFIHLNTDSFSALSSHPYIKYKLAGMICNYRKQHSGFSDADELKLLPLVTEENFRKLAPYLRPD